MGINKYPEPLRTVQYLDPTTNKRRGGQIISQVAKVAVIRGTDDKMLTGMTLRPGKTYWIKTA